MLSDAKNEASDENESKSDSSDSDDDMDTYNADFYKQKSEYADKNKTKRRVKDGNMKLFYLFTTQCSLQMITELKSTEKIEDLEMKQDCIGILGLIWEVMCAIEKHLQDTWLLVQADKALHTFWQKPDMTDDEYLKLFNSRVTAL